MDSTIRSPLTGASARLIVDVAVRLLADIAARPGKSRFVSVFDSVCAPPEPLLSYAARLYEHLHCSAECFALSLIYMNRYLEAARERLSVTNAHRLLVTAVRLATKFFDDHHCSNRSCAALGGIRTKELNQLEAQFLRVIGWRAYVSEKECAFCMEALRLLESDGCKECEESMEALQFMVCGYPPASPALSTDSGSPRRRRKEAISEATTPPKRRQPLHSSARRHRVLALAATGKVAAISSNKTPKACPSAGHKPQSATPIKCTIKVHLKAVGRKATEPLVARQPFLSPRLAFFRSATVGTA